MNTPRIPDINKYSDINSCDAVKLMFISLAKEEEAIAQLLEAGKNNILHANKKSDNCCELLKINESVNDTVKNILKLEMLLDFKLEKIKKMMENCIKCETKRCKIIIKTIHHCGCSGCKRGFSKKLNEYAEEGFRVVSIVPSSRGQGMSEEFLVVLEKCV